ncbi:hypothetical protein NQ317_017486 [Molorchus minor]|uniref:Uncharacterized protein n=1 Tax=Molorchus minor TaxID=1323400 RepID=A0ABQ9JLB7_9CUCU|nr:hypothetical protein NQ317_017486 [Molorchus minor]
MSTEPINCNLYELFTDGSAPVRSSEYDYRHGDEMCTPCICCDTLSMSISFPLPGAQRDYSSAALPHLTST